jgi:hypothetical protein
LQALFVALQQIFRFIQFNAVGGLKAGTSVGAPASV